MKGPNNEQARRHWLEEQLKSIPAGSSLLDVGAGECQYKEYCSHLNYVAQDVAIYDGGGNERGLQTGKWDFSRIDMICDILEIPEDKLFDVVLCTEVLEHVPDPAASFEKLLRLVKEGGVVIVTAPFSSLTHFAPYHFATGFSEYFYRHFLDKEKFEIEILMPNGGYFDFMVQELGRANRMSKKFIGAKPGFFKSIAITAAREAMKRLAEKDGARNARKSGEMLTFGWHLRARRKSNTL